MEKDYSLHRTKKRSGCLVIILALITFICFSSHSAEAASVKKVVGGTFYLDNPGSTQLMWMPAKGAKKYQVFKSKSIKGKYKKFKTTKKPELKIKPHGLVCYKIRGIKGRSKGSFSPVIVVYNFAATVENIVSIPNKALSIAKIKINNKTSNSRKITFYNPRYPETYSVFDDYYETVLENANVYYSDAKGNKTSPSINAGQIGYIYITIKSRNAPYYYKSAYSKNNNIDMAIALPYFIKDKKKKKYFGNTNIQIQYRKSYVEQSEDYGFMD